MSADTEVLLTRMGYKIQQQKPWGAVALIASAAMSRMNPADAPADSVVTHMPGPAVFFGANDPRRPGGAALAP